MINNFLESFWRKLNNRLLYIFFHFQPIYNKLFDLISISDFFNRDPIIIYNEQQFFMSRTVPWRNKPTTLITQMIPVANQLKLYLVNEIGPTSFLFKDDFENKFKVNIGSKISCSCGIVQNDHCIHTLYVLLKKYKVPENNPIIWQASYLDSELENLIQMKYQEKKKAATTYKFMRKKISKTNDIPEFPPLNQDDTCPICYEGLENECYSNCSVCKKPIHSKCLKIWALHKQNSQSQKVSCPMCRSEMVNPIAMIYKDLQKWQALFSTHKGSFCHGCGKKNIQGKLFRCLLCDQVQLCRLCFQSYQHPQHQRYFYKELVSSPWQTAPIRQRKTKKSILNQTSHANFSIDSSDFIVSLFPKLKDYNANQSINQLGIIGNEILTKQICTKCQTIGNQNMLRLNCSHSVHQICLRSMIQEKDFRCSTDQELICPGYLKAMDIKVKPTKTKKMAQCVLLKNQEELQKIHQHVVLESTQYPNKTVSSKISGRNISVDVQNKKNFNKQISKGSVIRKAVSKDKNFRISKKSSQQKKQFDMLRIQPGFSPILVTGIGQFKGQINFNPPRPPRQLHR